MVYFRKLLNPMRLWWQVEPVPVTIPTNPLGTLIVVIPTATPLTATQTTSPKLPPPLKALPTIWTKFYWAEAVSQHVERTIPSP